MSTATGGAASASLAVGQAQDIERNCTLLINSNLADLPSVEQLKKQLESKDELVKVDALKSIIFCILNGMDMSKVLMHVIKYSLHTENHTIKKLLLLFWEAVDKKNPDGSLKHEMILVCNAMKNNLDHPNEFIRGATLRFLCNMKEHDILESLIPSITSNLEHRHSYVRKNAALAVFTVYQAFPELIQDAPELIEKFLYAETNAASKRNAFLMLEHCDQQRALNYLGSMQDQLGAAGEAFQLVALELMRKVCRIDPVIKGQYIRSIFDLTKSPSNAVSFEAANTLVSLSAAPTALRAAIGAYTHLLSAESDNNVKLIILSRLASLKRRHEKILQDALMDILRTLSSPNVDIRRKTLELALDLVTARQVDEVVQLLKKEMIRAEQPEHGRNEVYRKLLVDAMHKCAVKFPEVVGSVAELLLNYLGDDNASAALDVVYFVREIVAEYPAMRNQILTKLMESFDEIRSADVYKVAIWIIGEYAIEPAVLDYAISTVRQSVGELPLLPPLTPEEVAAMQGADGQQPNGVAEEKQQQQPSFAPKSTSSTSRVLADGTYASQSATQVSDSVNRAALAKEKQNTLRTLIVDGNYFLAASVATALTKLLLRFSTVVGYGTPDANREIAQGMLLMTSILRLGKNRRAKKPIDPDSYDRILMCIRTMMNPKPLHTVFLQRCREQYDAFIKSQRSVESKENAKSSGKRQRKAADDEKGGDGADDGRLEVVREADDLITIRQLRGPNADADLVDEDESDLTRAVGAKLAKPEDFVARLNRVYQLTGFGDPVYAEAFVNVIDYDIVMEILVVNQTDQVLRNLQVELSTSRDLRIVERPQSFNIAAHGVKKITSNIKVSSTEASVIFGNITYDNVSGQDQTIVVLNSIHMDIIDYIHPAFCSDDKFRNMWAEFEWENPIAVNTEIGTVKEYLDHVLKITNMQCLTPDAALSGSCGFLAANLYAKSIFGEDALLNLSVERLPTGRVGGFIRIRSKSQGIALSLGDKIKAAQRGDK